MAIDERIRISTRKLPMAYQVEILDLVEHLLTKTPQTARENETSSWSDLSLALAMRDGCYGSRYFGGSVPHTGRGNRGTSRQPDSAHGQRILALRMCQG
ncbi:MAG: hypothetical protein BECKG1743E_GA0114224_110591, partial [Candidatus Kentron sp. G]